MRERVEPSDPFVANDPWLRRLLDALIVVAVLWSVGSAGYAAWAQDWTTDEPVHLAWSDRFWRDGATERDSAARFDSKTPVHVMNVIARSIAAGRGIDDERRLRFIARLPQIAWLFVAFLAAGGIGWRVGGSIVARLAVLLAALDPNLTAHGSVITTDMPLAAATGLVLWAALRHRARPSIPGGIALGAAIGLSLVAKFSAVLLVPIALGVAFFKTGVEGRRLARQIGICLCAAWIVLGAAYRFDRVLAPIGPATWKSSLFVSASSSLPSFPAPLPMSFLEGIDRSRYRDATVPLSIAIAGQVTDHPLWYYFVVAWAFKTPIALIVISLLCVPWIVRRSIQDVEIRWLLIHQVVTLGFFSVAFRTQLGYRFVLMLIPVTSALVAVVLSRLSARRIAIVASVVAVISLIEARPFFDDPIAFSNALVRPKAKAYLYLANADIDWNQNRDRWVEKRKAASLPDNGVLNAPDLQLGLNVVSTSVMAGVAPGDRFRWAREHLEPRGIAGWTHHYFDVTETQYDSFLEEARKLEPTPDARELCGLSAEGEMDPPGRVLPLVAPDAPSGLRVSVLCVATRRGTDIAARADAGRFDFVPSANADLKTYLGPGTRVVFRLTPGVHAFAILETPYRREELDYHLEASFWPERHGALLRILHVDAASLPSGSGLARWFGSSESAER
jgi:hypothetical protein